MADTVSERHYLGRLAPGMDVCDVTGEKVGTIAHIFRHDEGLEAGTVSRSDDEIIEVKTGFLGMGKHLYIPLSDVQEVLTDSIFLSKSRETFDEAGYEMKPAHLERLH